jgi:Predicted acyltransferase
MNTKTQRIVFFVEVDERQIWYMKDCEIISVGRDADLLEECLNVRRAVFQVEKGIPRDIDIDSHDCINDVCEHFLMRYDNKNVGTVRCKRDIEKREIRLQRFCVLSDYRKFGLGRKMLEFIEVYFNNKGFEWIRLDSKFAVHGFYEKSGYRVVSDVFMEAGVAHVKMEKRINCC